MRPYIIIILNPKVWFWLVGNFSKVICVGSLILKWPALHHTSLGKKIVGQGQSDSRIGEGIISTYRFGNFVLGTPALVLLKAVAMPIVYRMDGVLNSGYQYS